MNSERNAMLSQMNVRKLLIKLTIPATIAMLVNALYNLVDTIFVAWGSGEIAIGALGIVFPVQMIVMAVGLMIGMGSASIFSRAYGRGDADSMRRVVNTALIFNAAISLAFTIVGLLFLDWFLVLFGASASNIDFARDYMFYILISLVPFSSAMVLNNLTRAEGRANVAMVSLIIGAGLNIILDPIFIFDFGLGLGVKGAAIATLISKVVMFAFIFSASLSKKSTLAISLKTIHRLDFKMILEIIIIGVPTFFRNSLGAVMVVIVNRLINVYAPTDPAIYVAIYSVINRIIMFLFLPGFGLVQGLIPIVGFSFGAKKQRRLYEVISYGTRLLILYFVMMFIIMAVFAQPIFMMFSREADAYFIRTGTRALRVISFGFTVLGFQFIMSSVYQAMGFPVRAFLISLSRQFLLFIPLVFLLTSIYGIAGIWISYLAADSLSGLISFGAYQYEMRNLHKKVLIEDFHLAQA